MAVPKIIAVTGGIGSGKSIVSRICRCKGYPVYDCDLEAKRLMDSNTELHSGIASVLGAECVVDGVLNRKVIAEKVFADAEALSWLNSQVHTLVIDDFKSRIDGSGAKIFFIESAIPTTAGFEAFCDAFWLVNAPVHVRLQRVAERDNSSREAIEKRMKSQEREYESLPPEKTFIIDNDGSESLIMQIDRLLE